MVGRGIKDISGQRFSLLLAVRPTSKNRQGVTLWECICNCGVVVNVSHDHLTRSTKPVKSCRACSVKRHDKHHQFNGIGDISGGWWYDHVTRERAQTQRSRVECTVSIEYAWRLFLKQERKCAYSGIELVICNNRQQNTASVDRIDSSKGYVEGNIQWVHKHVNFMKRTYTDEYFVYMCNLIAKHRPTQVEGGKCDLV